MPFSKLKIEIIDVTIEKAYEIAQEIPNAVIHEGNSSKVFSGKHPKYGAIHVTIPPLGDASLLPIVVQNLDC